MRSPTAALVWEIWRKNRYFAWLAIALTLFGCLFNAFYGESFRATKDGRDWLIFLNSMMGIWSLIFVYGIFNYTEFSPQKQWTGFPYHLFALPVRTRHLVALPMVVGVATVELDCAAWIKFVFAPGDLVRPEWLAALFGAYLVFFQTILWTLAAFRIVRIVILSLVGTSVIGVGLLPYMSKYSDASWLAEKILIPALAGMALLAYLIAWNAVARQRTGGGRRENWLKNLIERGLDRLPRRRSAFASAASAQFWFEWRRSGLLLPAIVGAILVLVVAPLSWHLRNEAGIVLWILPQALMMPVILAAAISKNFSKADFWSTRLALPSFAATQPMATGEMVRAKLKAAAFSVLLTWALLVSFFCAWLVLWANVDQLSMFRVGYWMVYGHSVFPQYVIAVLIIAAGMLLTWRFLINGFCVGLSGSRKWYYGSALAYFLAAIISMIAFSILLNHNRKFMAWVRHDPNQLLSVFEWVIAVAVIAKLWLAAFSWRRNSPRRTLQYLLCWGGATLLLIALAKLIWANGCLSLSLMSAFDFLPLDPYRLEHLLILLALLAVPLARLGFAPASLARNRCGDFVGRDEP